MHAHAHRLVVAVPAYHELVDVRLSSPEDILHVYAYRLVATQGGHYELVDVGEYSGRGILETENKLHTHDKILPEFLSCFLSYSFPTRSCPTVASCPTMPRLV